MDRHTGRLTGRVAELYPHGILSYFYGAFLLGFLLANHLYLPCSQSMFSISQDPPMCVHTSLSQDEFYCKGLWIEHPLTADRSHPCTAGRSSTAWASREAFISGSLEVLFDFQGAFLFSCGQGGLLTLRMRNMCFVSLKNYVLSFNWEKYFIFALRVNVAKFCIANCYDKYLATYGSCLGWENFDLMTLFVWGYLHSLSTFLLWEKSAIHYIYLSNSTVL